MLLLCASSYSLLAAGLWFLFLGRVSRPSVCSGVFPLVFLAFVSVGLRPVSVLSCFWASCPFSCWGSRFSLPLAVFACDHGVSVPICSKVSSGLDGSSSAVVFRRLLLFIGLLWVGWPILFLFSVSLFLVCSLGGVALRVFLLLAFGHLYSSLSCFRRAPGLLFASGGVFLPSLPSWSVGFPGSPRLGVPLCSGRLFPGLSLFCVFGL